MQHIAQPCNGCRKPSKQLTEWRSNPRIDGTYAVKLWLCPACCERVQDRILAMAGE